MKRLWLVPFIVMITMLSYPLLSFADYIIYLKSGRQFVTERYWEEGGEIKFHFKSGVLGIPRAAVVSIEEVIPEAPAKKEPPPEAVPKAPVKKEAPPEAEVSETAEKTDNDLVDIEYYKREKQRLEQELDEAKRRYLSSLENGDKETRHAASRDALKINIQIDQLKKELKGKNKGVLPEWWNE